MSSSSPDLDNIPLPTSDDDSTPQASSSSSENVAPPPPKSPSSSAAPPPPKSPSSSAAPPPPKSPSSSAAPPPPKSPSSSAAPPPPKSPSSSAAPPPPKGSTSSAAPPPPVEVAPSPWAVAPTPPPPSQNTSVTVPVFPPPLSPNEQGVHTSEGDSDKLTAEAQDIKTNRNVFLWGKTRAGKTSLIASFHRAALCDPNSKLDFIAKTQHTSDFLALVNQKILDNQQAVVGTLENSKPHIFIVRDKKKKGAIELSLPDGPGGAMFEGDVGSEINNMMLTAHKELVKIAQQAEQIIFCVNATEKDQDYYGISFLKRLDEIADQNTRQLKCDRFLIVLTKADLLAYHGAAALGGRLHELLSEEYSGAQNLKEDNLITPRSVADWLDPVEMAKATIGPYALHQLFSYLKPKATLAVALCSAWGFDKDTGQLIAGADGSFNTQYLDRHSHEGNLDFWNPYGTQAILEHILYGSYSTTLRPITKKEISSHLVNDGGRI